MTRQSTHPDRYPWLSFSPRRLGVGPRNHGAVDHPFQHRTAPFNTISLFSCLRLNSVTLLPRLLLNPLSVFRGHLPQYQYFVLEALSLVLCATLVLGQLICDFGEAVLEFFDDRLEVMYLPRLLVAVNEEMLDLNG